MEGPTVKSWLPRIWLSGVFLLSGLLKALAPDRFLLDLKSFEMLPHQAAYATALVLPWLEIVAAIGLWWRPLARGSALILLLLALAFILALGGAAIRGLDLECGCFGDWFLFPNLWMHLLFNASLVLAAILLLRRRARPRQ